MKELTKMQYLTLRNTARVLRGAGVQLQEEDEQKLQRIESDVREYEIAHGLRNAETGGEA